MNPKPLIYKYNIIVFHSSANTSVQDLIARSSHICILIQIQQFLCFQAHIVHASLGILRRALIYIYIYFLLFKIDIHKSDNLKI